MTQQTRRQFFKTVATTVAAAAATVAVVAPSVAPKVVIANGMDKPVLFKSNRVQAVIFDEFAKSRQQGMPSSWKMYCSTDTL